MKKIALLGLLTTLLAVGDYSCSSGADTSGDGGDTVHPDGSVA